MAIIYNCASTLNGFLADEQDSLQWLFDVPGVADAEADIAHFLSTIDALVMGSTTYEWLLEALGSPLDLNTSYGNRPIWVFTSRDLPVAEGTQVRLINSSVAEALPRIRKGAENIWIMGGGDLTGQFFEAGALDRIILTLAPVFLPAGRPTLPYRIGSEHLHLRETRQLGQFVELSYDCTALNP